MFEVTSEAADAIEEMVRESSDDSLRLTIFSTGVGCGGPTLKVDMKPPLDDDVVETRSGCTFYVRSVIHKNLEGAVIEVQDTFWGRRIHVKTTYSCMG